MPQLLPGTGTFAAGFPGAFAVHRLLGIMQCTPLRTSTTWLTRQSAAMAAGEANPRPGATPELILMWPIRLQRLLLSVVAA